MSDAEGLDLAAPFHAFLYEIDGSLHIAVMKAGWRGAEEEILCVNFDRRCFSLNRLRMASDKCLSLCSTFAFHLLCWSTSLSPACLSPFSLSLYMHIFRTLCRIL